MVRAGRMGNVLARFTNFTKLDTWEDKAFDEDSIPSASPVGKSVGHFLDC